jgi:hypothetical protein
MPSKTSDYHATGLMVQLWTNRWSLIKKKGIDESRFPFFVFKT